MLDLRRADPEEEYEEMELSDNEKDAMAVNCGLCWSRPQELCRVMIKDRATGKLKVTARTRRHPHPERIGRAWRRGMLGGAGRALLEQNRKIDG